MNTNTNISNTTILSASTSSETSFHSVAGAGETLAVPGGPGTLKAVSALSSMYWKEIRNDYFENKEDLSPEDGDMLAAVSIDAWKTDDEWEEGVVVARVMLSNHGDILVDYRDGIAREDEVAQAAIEEAKQELRAYYENSERPPRVLTARQHAQVNSEKGGAFYER